MPDTTLEQLLRPEVLESLNSLPPPQPVITSSDNPTQTTTEPDEEEFEFHLFSTSAQTPTADAATTAPKINLRSPPPSSTNPGFVIPHRPREYYFADHGRRAEYQNIAVTGEDILAQRKVRWTGNFLPWRITTFNSSITPSTPSLQQPEQQPTTLSLQAPPKPKCRTSKKRRLAIRKKEKTNTERSKQAVQSRAIQEAAEREKRTRRNREKKVKKKEREKAKKSEKGVGGWG
ncbi:MAG: hypothetical protein M1812_004326 [Candelaria pacifica]|nr:MAG: hypothetical protein M1812_004326 [Candelaria pacifica]